MAAIAQSGPSIRPILARCPPASSNLFSSLPGNKHRGPAACAKARDERETGMGYSRTGWAAGAIAPWCLGMALAVSMSADAGQEAASGASFAPLPWRAPAPPAVLVPAQPPALSPDFGRFPGDARKALR